MSVAPEVRAGRGKDLLWIALVAAVFCLFRVGSTPLLETDEGFAANRAGSILRHGSWLLTYDEVDEDGPQFRKPPLLYWIIAAFYKTMGYNLWSVRLPTALSGVGVAVLLALLAGRFLGPTASRWAALLPLSVPFYLHHVRTAMLDVPLLFLILLGAYTFAYARCRATALLTLALTTGAALLLKKTGAMLGPLLAFALALVGRDRRKGWILDLAIACGLSLLPTLAYYAALDPAFRGELREQFVTSQALGNLAPHMSKGRLYYVLHVMASNLQGFFWLGLAGAVWMLVAPRGGERRWVWVALLFCVPLVIMTSREAVPYPRYTLAVYPFLIACAAVAACRIPELKYPLVGAVPAAVILAVALPGPWRWVVAAVFLAAPFVRSAREREMFGTLALAAVGVALWASPSSRNYIDAHAWEDMSGPSALAAEASARMDPDEKLIINGRFKCHNVLWHGRHALRSFERWVSCDVQPGETRWALSNVPIPEGVPGLSVRTVKQIGCWSLLELRVDPGPTLENGFLLCLRPDKSALEEELRLMDVAFDRHPLGLIPHALPEWTVATGVVATASWAVGESVRPWKASHGRLVLEPGRRYVARWDGPVPVCGVNLLVKSDRTPVRNLEYVVHSVADDEWHVLARVEVQPTLRAALRGKRIEYRVKDQPALTVRHAPLESDAVMLMTHELTEPAELLDVRLCRMPASRPLDQPATVSAAESSVKRPSARNLL